MHAIVVVIIYKLICGFHHNQKVFWLYKFWELEKSQSTNDLPHFFTAFLCMCAQQTSQNMRKKQFNCQKFICTKATSYKVHTLEAGA